MFIIVPGEKLSIKRFLAQLIKTGFLTVFRYFDDKYIYENNSIPSYNIYYMRTVRSFLITILFISCNNGEEKFAPNEVENKLTFDQQEKLELRQKVYEQLLSDQLKFDSTEMVMGSMGVPGKANADTVIDCGTRLTIEEYDEISAYFDNVCRPELAPTDKLTPLTYPLFFYIVARNDNRGSITPAEVRSALKDLQSKYDPAKIIFTVAGIDTLQSNDFYDFDAANEFKIIRRKKPNCITVFIFNSLRSGNTSLNGYTKMSRGDDFVMITGNAVRNLTTFPHELGHYFLLYHTHGKSNNGNTDELVERTGCSCSGDDVCDTPADPNLFGLSMPNCIYPGTQKDANGVVYMPDPTNLMSYAHLCRKRFTPGQYNRIRWAALSYRNYLIEGF